MRCIWMFCLAAGCSFAATAPGSTGDDPPGTGQGPGQGQGGVDAGVPPIATCDVTADPSLQLCLTFDHDPMVQDLSGFAHAVTDALGVTPIDHNGSPAATLTLASRIHIAEDSKLDVGQLTIDMWIAPAPAITQHSWLLDNNTQYFLTYEMDRKIRCGIGSKVVTSAATVPSTGWHHVACTYGSNHELRVYIDGDRSGCLDGSSAIPTTGTDGIAIGANYSSAGAFAENYVGGIDAVHVYGRALTDTQVCTAAGQTGCRVINCDGGGPGPGGGPGF